MRASRARWATSERETAGADTRAILRARRDRSGERAASFVALVGYAVDCCRGASLPLPHPLVEVGRRLRFGEIPALSGVGAIDRQPVPRLPRVDTLGHHAEPE